MGLLHHKQIRTIRQYNCRSKSKNLPCLYDFSANVSAEKATVF